MWWFIFTRCKTFLPAYNSAKTIRINRDFPELWSQMYCYLFMVHSVYTEILLQLWRVMNNQPLTVFFVLNSKLMARIITRVLTCWWPCNIDKVFTRLPSSDRRHTWCYNTSLQHIYQQFKTHVTHVTCNTRVSTFSYDFSMTVHDHFHDYFHDQFHAPTVGLCYTIKKK